MTAQDEILLNHSGTIAIAICEGILFLIWLCWGTKKIRQRHGKPFNKLPAFCIAFFTWLLHAILFCLIIVTGTGGVGYARPKLTAFLFIYWIYSNLREKYLKNCFTATGTPEERLFYSNILGITPSMSKDEIIKCYVTKKKTALNPEELQNIELAYTFFIEPKKFEELVKKNRIPSINALISNNQVISTNIVSEQQATSISTIHYKSSDNSSNTSQTELSDYNKDIPSSSSASLEITSSSENKSNVDSNESQKKLHISDNIEKTNTYQNSAKNTYELSVISNKHQNDDADKLDDENKESANRNHFTTKTNLVVKENQQQLTSNFHEITNDNQSPRDQEQNPIINNQSDNNLSSSSSINNTKVDNKENTIITNQSFLQTQKIGKDKLKNEGIILLLISIIIICICLIMFFDRPTQQFEVENYEKLVSQVEHYIQKKYKTPMANKLATDELKSIINNNELIKIEKIDLIFTNILKIHDKDNKVSYGQKYPQLVDKAEKLFLQGKDAYYGKGREKNINEAVVLLNNSAELGNSEAQALLAVYYFGLPKSNSVLDNGFCEAFKWSRKSALQGNGIGQQLLGICYFYGYGTNRNGHEAFKWSMEAAEKNMPLAQCVIGECYLEGFGVEANRRQAEYWLRMAANKGNDYAKKLLSKHFQQ